MDAITNSLSQVFITSNKSSQRLYIFTGKGGTGKTTLAMSYALALKNSGKKVYYVAFDQIPDAKICRKIDLPFLSLIQEEVTLEFVTEKLGTRILANWIIQSAFFKALIQMLPGVMYLILLGDILKRLERENDLHIILDLPSSGHALTLFEAPANFSSIFGKGPLFEDLKLFKHQLFSSHFTKVTICSLPSELSYNEATELADELRALDKTNIHILFNNSFASLDLDEKKLPAILKKKIKLEQKVLDEGEKNGVKIIIPAINLNTPSERVKAIAKLWENYK